MHTLVVSMATDPDRFAAVSMHLRSDITAWAKQQPGFVRGEWLLSENHDAGRPHMNRRRSTAQR